MLRALGYGGNLFESRILQAKGFSIDDGKVVARPFDKIKADRLLRSTSVDSHGKERKQSHTMYGCGILLKMGR